MDESDGAGVDALLAERVVTYRRRWILHDVTNRIRVVSLCLSDHEALSQQREAAVAAWDAFRAGVDAALGLAATPTATCEAAEAKIHCLRLAIAHVVRRTGEGAPVDPQHFVVGPMLAEAVAAERRWWPGSRSTGMCCGEGAAGHQLRACTGFARQDLYGRRAEPRDFAQLLGHIAVTARDLGVLRDHGDWPGAIGARDELRSAVLAAMAAPARDPKDLDTKGALLARYRDALRPWSLVRPMLEVALGADLLRIGATPERAAALVAAPPWAVG